MRNRVAQVMTLLSLEGIPANMIRPNFVDAFAKARGIKLSIDQVRELCNSLEEVVLPIGISIVGDKPA